MTNVEKAINREDLIAYKNFDDNQYAMIPGVNNLRKFMGNEQYQPKIKSYTVEEQNKRLQLYGFNRE